MPAFRASCRVDVGLQHRCAKRQHIGMVHVRVDSIRLPVVVQPASAIPDVGSGQHHVVGELPLVRHRPVLEPRQRQTIRVDGDDVPTDIDCGIDERRKLDSVRGKARVQVMCGEDAVGVVRREWGRCESLRRRSALVERNVRVVDPVAPAKGLLVVDSIGEAQARTPGILGDVLELALSRAARTVSREDHRARNFSRSGIRCRRAEGRGPGPRVRFGPTHSRSACRRSASACPKA